ncbi:MAG: radical SAM family heme chaperone HemW [Bacteroidales bacterium]
MIYVHFPFCKSLCSYCNYFSVTACENIQDVVTAIHQEWLLERDAWAPLLFNKHSNKHHTLYIGGGTPSLCPQQDLQPLVTSLIQDSIVYSGNAPIECTLEANPGDLSPSSCRALLDMGINRLSIGIQSFFDQHLQAMERRHTAAEGKETIHTAREAGFTNISIDLLFGFPGLTQHQWQETLLQAVESKPDHIAAYQLSLEPDTPWGESQTLPPQETCLQQYATLQEILTNHGYLQYEVSAFCLPGKKALHNSAYWQRIPYIGLGPAAHSFNGKDRYENVADINRYIMGIRKKSPYRTYDRLLPYNVHNEWILLQLRTTTGFSLKQLLEREGQEAVTGFLERITPLQKQGLLIKEYDRVYIPAHALFLSDYIIRECLLPS